MKISGTVLNSKNYEPIALAKIRLEVQDKEVGTLFFTDEHGYYEFKSDQDYIGQTLKYTIEKDGFEEKTFSTVIDKAEIQKKFLLRESEPLKEKFALLKGFVLLLVILAVVLFIFLNLQPNIDVENSEPLYFKLDLNDKQTKTFYINTEGWGDLTWSVSPDREWIKVEPSSGNISRNLFDKDKYVTVNVTVYTPDTEVSPVDNVTAKLTIGMENDWFDGKYANNNLETKLDISISEKSLKPILDVIKPEDRYWNSDLDQIFQIDVKNKGNGSLFWTVRDDVKWIQLTKVDGTDVSGKNDQFKFVDFDKGYVIFVINSSELNLTENRTKEGNIIIESNNDGKIKIKFKLNQSGGQILLHPILHRYNSSIG